jgi:alkanesulfonate monooxygenase SsuD/methylene tetrahydromethanopterin reductase-like flavin-dependent oxidoreductase (luciferase family)
MSSETSATLAAKTDSQIVGLAERAESLGFDSVWVGDSVLAKPRHEPLTTLAAIAGATSSVKLGTAVYLPNLRDPVNIAHLTATVDQLSGGRLLLGVGTGTAGAMGSDIQNEYEELGVPWEDRGKLLNEQLNIIRRLWAGEPLEYDGEFYQYEDASIGFQPVRDPPLYIGSGVHPEKGVLKSIRERIAEYGDGWFPAMAEPDVYERTLEQIEDTVERTGRDPSHLDKLYYLDVVDLPVNSYSPR